MKYTIFALDDHTFEGQAEFHRWVRAKREMGTAMNPQSIIGCYKGGIETSYIMLTRDYEHLSATTSMVSAQESVMQVSGCNKAYCHLKYAEGGLTFLGSLHEVSANDALDRDAWSYRPDVDGGTYWVAAPGNPNRIISEGL